MNEDGTFKPAEARPGTPFKGLPTPTVRTVDIPANAFRPDPAKITQLPRIDLANHHGMPWSKLRAAWNAVSEKRLGGDETLSKLASDTSKFWLMCGGFSEEEATGYLKTMAERKLMGDVGDNLAQAICWFPHNLVTGPKEENRVDDPGNDDFDCFCYMPVQVGRCAQMEKIYDSCKVPLDEAHLRILKDAFETLSKEKLTAPTPFDVQHWVLASYPHGYNPKTNDYDRERGGKPSWQKRVLVVGDVNSYIQGSVFDKTQDTH